MLPNYSLIKSRYFFCSCQARSHDGRSKCQPPERRRLLLPLNTPRDQNLKLCGGEASPYVVIPWEEAGLVTQQRGRENGHGVICKFMHAHSTNSNGTRRLHNRISAFHHWRSHQSLQWRNTCRHDCFWRLSGAERHQVKLVCKKATLRLSQDKWVCPPTWKQTKAAEVHTVEVKTDSCGEHFAAGCVRYKHNAKDMAKWIQAGRNVAQLGAKADPPVRRQCHMRATVELGLFLLADISDSLTV